jgi:hypothetical protein
MRVIKKTLQVCGEQWVRENEMGVEVALLNATLCYFKT